MTLVERALLTRSEEQLMDPSAWRATRRESREEKSAPKCCEVPGCAREIVGRPSGARICLECKEKGLSGKPCRGCGGPLREIDRRHTHRERRGYCQACRADMPQAYRGAQTLVLARSRAVVKVRRFAR